MQLVRIEIEDFRGIDRLDLDLDELTTIIGEPDCGKSSLLRAIARVLGPRADDGPPSFKVTDFHRPGDDEDGRASSLAITLWLSATEDDDLAAGLPGVEDGGVAARVVASRSDGSDGADGAEPITTVDIIDRAGVPLEGIDGLTLLTRLRRRHPAVIVGGRRPWTGEDLAGGEKRGPLRSVLAGAAQPREPLTWDQISEIREEVLAAAGRLALELGPVPERRRSVLAMTDTPQALVTDLRAALDEDAGRQRRIAALWLLAAVLEAVPEAGLGEEAEPILLFDDIEANLHPTWLAAYASVALNLPFQQVVATHSPEVLSWVPLTSLRRLARGADGIEARSVRTQRYSLTELRRLTFHVRLNRGSSFFARAWVLVEGETEAWLLPELARIGGVEFPVEGIRVIEFAQSGVEPLVKLADDLGIDWLLLADGDPAGQRYASRAREYLESDPGGGSVVVLPARDIEHYLFASGYADVIKKAAQAGGTLKADKLIGAAVERVSKPGLALLILAAADERGPEGVPPVIRELVEHVIRMARD